MPIPYGAFFRSKCARLGLMIARDIGSARAVPNALPRNGDGGEACRTACQAPLFLRRMRVVTVVTEYERYLRVPELLVLQKPLEARTHADELLFQSVHQVEELWMNVATDEIARITTALAGDDLDDARARLHRVYLLEKLMSQQLRLLETMAPVAYFHIRSGLGHGSGLESPGFNKMIRESKKIEEAFAAVCRKRRVTTVDLLRDPGKDRALFDVAEAMIDVDAAFQEFRYQHYALVKRIIGGGTPSLKGNMIELLEKNFKKEFFPELWAAREELFKDFVPGTLKA
jgi:tryptophan 2,3-dioxygenase